MAEDRRGVESIRSSTTPEVEQLLPTRQDRSAIQISHPTTPSSFSFSPPAAAAADDNNNDDESDETTTLLLLTSSSSLGSSSLTWIFLCLSIKIVSAASSLPVLPFFVTNTLGGGPVELGNSVSVFAFSQMIGSIVLGHLSDAFGRKWILITTFFWSAIGFLLTSLSYSIPMLYIARAVTGLSGGSIAIASAMVADVTPIQHRPHYNGLMGAILGIAFVLGPALGGITHVLVGSRRLCFIVGFLGGIQALLLGIFKLPETLPIHRRRYGSLFTQRFRTRRRRQQQGQKSKDETNNLLEKTITTTTTLTVDYVGLSMVCLVRFFLSFAGAVMGGTYFLLVQDTFHFERPERQISKILTISGLCVILYQGVVFRRVVHHTGLHGTMVLGCLAYSLGLYTAWRSIISCSLFVHILLCCLTYSVAYSLVEPNIPTMSSIYVDTSYQGVAHGSVSACRFLASIVAPALYGRLYETYTPYPFWIATILALLPISFISIARFYGTPIMDTLNSRTKH